MRWSLLLTLLLCACEAGGISSGLLDSGITEVSVFRGQIVDDATGEPIAGAEVRFDGRTTTTATDGTFSVSQVKVGDVWLEVAATAYFMGGWLVRVDPATLSMPHVFGLTRDCFNFGCAAGYFCGLTHCEKSAGGAVLMGKVTDVCSFALVEAKVTFGTTRVCTDGGVFRFEGRLAGEFEIIEVSAPGYDTYRANVNTLDAGLNVEDVALWRADGLVCLGATVMPAPAACRL